MKKRAADVRSFAHSRSTRAILAKPLEYENTCKRPPDSTAHARSLARSNWGSLRRNAYNCLSVTFSQRHG